MTREHVAEMIHWSTIMYVMGFINVTAMLPQLYRLHTTKDAKGLSLLMFSIFLLVQSAFALQGFFTRDVVLMTSLGMSAVVSFTTISYTLFLRKTQK